LNLRPTLFVAAALYAAASAVPASAEATRQLRIQLSGDPGRAFAVENLAGTMRVTAGSSDTVVATATIHAENEELAAAMRFEQVVGHQGVPTLRVRYPVDRHRVYRFGRSSSHDGEWSWLEGLFGAFGGGNSIEYDGVRVRVSGSQGVMVYADVEVQVPRRTIDGAFRNRVGPLSADGVQGRARFDSGSGDIDVRGTQGQMVADTGSGDVHASDVRGSFSCDTGSGDCEVTGFTGDDLACDTGSGDVRIVNAEARRLKLDTGSGDVEVREVDAEEIEADTGSGDVAAALAGARLARVKADTGSGNVHLRLGPDASFHVSASTGSGDVVSHYADAEAIRDGRKIVGYRRGDGRIRIHADTGSGDVVVQP
jgi:putative adhesin